MITKSTISDRMQGTVTLYNATFELEWHTKPFTVETDFGLVYISETSPGWDEGYFVVFPRNGIKPYPAPRHVVKANYTLFF